MMCIFICGYPYGSTLFEGGFAFYPKVIFDLEDNLLIKNNFDKTALFNPITSFKES